MKSQFRSIWFSLVLPFAVACGGDRVTPAPTESAPVVAPQDKIVVDGAPVAELPVPVKVDKLEPAAEVVAMPAKYAERIAMGKALVARGEHPRARELFEAAAKLEKQQAEPYIELARSYIATNDRALAIKAANKAVKLAPKSSAAYNTLGRAELLRHGYDNAIDAFTTATELDPENAWAWNNLGYTHLLLKQYELAVLSLVEATAKPAATGYMWNNLGLAYEQLDELDNARFAFEKGGKLGSKEALASRKRLDGVDSIVVVTRPGPLDVADEAKSETSYPASEPEPEEVEVEVEVEEAEEVADDTSAADAERAEDKTLEEHVKDDAKSGAPAVPVPAPKPM